MMNRKSVKPECLGGKPASRQEHNADLNRPASTETAGKQPEPPHHNLPESLHPAPVMGSASAPHLTGGSSSGSNPVASCNLPCKYKFSGFGNSPTGFQALVKRHPDAPRFWLECGLRVTHKSGKRFSSVLPAQWSLVLASKNIPFQLVRQRGVTLLFVPPLRYQQACRELYAFLCEPPLRPKPPEANGTPDLRPIFTVLVALALWHALRIGWWGGLGQSPEQWLAAGALDADKLFAGQWFRGVTALTLHADALHLLGNCVFGGIALFALALRIGALNAVSLSFYAGVLGNLSAAFPRAGTGYSSIGASTALFGTMGILCGLAISMRDTHGWRGVLFPLAAGLAWLAFLGTEGVRVDIWSHITGLFSGLLLGLGIPKIWDGAKIPQASSLVLAGSALVLTAAAWLWAFFN